MVSIPRRANDVEVPQYSAEQKHVNECPICFIQLVGRRRSTLNSTEKRHLMSDTLQLVVVAPNTHATRNASTECPICFSLSVDSVRHSTQQKKRHLLSDTLQLVVVTPDTQATRKAASGFGSGNPQSKIKNQKFLGFVLVLGRWL